MDLITAVRKLLAGFAQPVPEETLAVYLDELARLDPQYVSLAVDKALRTCDRLPPIAELRRLALAARREDVGMYRNLNQKLLETTVTPRKPDDYQECDKCTFGIVSGWNGHKPGPLPLYKQKQQAYHNGDLQVCDCQRGQLFIKWCGSH